MWGNIAVEETVDVRHNGAVLKVRKRCIEEKFEKVKFWYYMYVRYLVTVSLCFCDKKEKKFLIPKHENRCSGKKLRKFFWLPGMKKVLFLLFTLSPLSPLAYVANLLF